MCWGSREGGRGDEEGGAGEMRTNEEDEAASVQCHRESMRVRYKHVK